jgi:enoyl-CoA hydratase/carnithine racemase
MPYETLIVSREETFAVVTLNRPPANAISETLMRELNAVLSEVESDDAVRSVIITGAGEKIFCAGADLGNAFSGPDVATFIRFGNSVARRIERFPKPVVAAINGHALGGGLELAVTCDLRVAGAGFKLGMPPGKLGLIYSHTGIQKFLDTVGPARTRELFLTGRNISAERAEQIDLVHETVQREEVEANSVALAAEIAGNAPLSLAGNKRIIRDLLTFPRLSEKVAREVIDLRMSSFSSEDFREGVKAFGEKRKPRWRGR